MHWRRPGGGGGRSVRGRNPHKLWTRLFQNWKLCTPLRGSRHGSLLQCRRMGAWEPLGTGLLGLVDNLPLCMCEVEHAQLVTSFTHLKALSQTSDQAKWHIYVYRGQKRSKLKGEKSPQFIPQQWWKIENVRYNKSFWKGTSFPRGLSSVHVF